MGCGCGLKKSTPSVRQVVKKTTSSTPRRNVIRTTGKRLTRRPFR